MRMLAADVGTGLAMRPEPLLENAKRSSDTVLVAGQIGYMKAPSKASNRGQFTYREGHK